MYKRILAGLAAALTLSISLAAQTKPLTGPVQTVTGTIEAIETSSRQIYLKKPDGNTEVEDKAALAKVKVGDKVDITWTKAMLVSTD